ncbi:hypothetical protein [Streptomyces spiralis]|uniref:hypothetical protein n=1 Tax=Streptomyces spiralis TaxID=66376 RepID=UPI003697559C
MMLIEAVGWLSLPWLPNFSAAMAVMVTIGIMESAGYVLYYAEVQIRIPRSVMGYYYAALVPVGACMFLGSAYGAWLAGSSVPAAAVIVASDGNSDAPHRSLVLHTAGRYQRDRFDARRRDIRDGKGRAWGARASSTIRMTTARRMSAGGLSGGQWWGCQFGHASGWLL